MNTILSMVPGFLFSGLVFVFCFLAGYTLDFILFKNTATPINNDIFYDSDNAKYKFITQISYLIFSAVLIAIALIAFSPDLGYLGRVVTLISLPIVITALLMSGFISFRKGLRWESIAKGFFGYVFCILEFLIFTMI